MHFVKQFRHHYLAAAPHTLYTSGCWFLSAIAGDFHSKTLGILLFISSASLTFPMGEFFRKLFGAPKVLSSENKLGRLFMLSAFGIPLCYPLVYFACKENSNMFFPAFSILVGAHYLIFVYGYGIWSFAVLGLLMAAQGTLVGLFHNTSFGTSGYFSAALLLIFGIFNLLNVKREII